MSEKELRAAKGVGSHFTQCPSQKTPEPFSSPLFCGGRW